ncbi:septation protein SepH [Microbacterium sp.]|uniref:septation protein SepH n=1 Tax=Microbacterium sp. TaxID=51671 RepID=UPI0039E4FEA2
MEQLKIIGTEEDVLVLATESGERFSLPVNEALRAQVRRTAPAAQQRATRPSPREIQAQIRAGLSSDEVASLFGIRVEDVVRYEGPVLAEREYIVGQALAVPVLMGGELEFDAQPTFGTAVRIKLAEAGATAERWTSWRDLTGWIVKVEFTANEVDHDARWSFDPRRSTLSPLNSDAVQLSRQGSLPEGLIPRLRALDAQTVKDESRFDSGAFGPRRLAEPEPDFEPPVVRPAAPSAAQDAAINRAPEAEVTSADTADLLEALRRRRGQREAMPAPQGAESPAHAPVALFDALEPGFDDAELPLFDEPAPARRVEPSRADEASHGEAGRKRGRAAMPTWDEIVFGARTEDG